MSIYPFKSSQFCFFPRKAESTKGLEVVISAPIQLKKVEDFYFQAPFSKWESIKGDQVVVVRQSAEELEQQAISAGRRNRAAQQS